MFKNQPKIKVSYRIPVPVMLILYAFSIVGDLLQLLFKLLTLTGIFAIFGEGLGWLITMFVILINSIIFIACGVNFLSGKRTVTKLTRFITTFLVEFLPVINLIPTLSVWTFFTIRESRQNDRERAKEDATITEGRHQQLHKRRLRERLVRAYPPARRVAASLRPIKQSPHIKDAKGSRELNRGPVVHDMNKERSSGRTVMREREIGAI